MRFYYSGIHLRSGFNGYRSKDEKEVLECFSGIFTALNPTMFKGIFSKYIEVSYLCCYLLLKFIVRK